MTFAPRAGCGTGFARWFLGFEILLSDFTLSAGWIRQSKEGTQNGQESSCCREGPGASGPNRAIRGEPAGRGVRGARGPAWGTLFSEIEELGVQVGDAVCRAFIQQSVSQQADDEPSCCQQESCPTCGGPLDHRDPEPKPLLTRRGEVSWQEPQTYCKKCRKAFFPSVQKFGDSC